MKISVKEVKNLNEKLKTSISSYENKYNEYYNYLNQTSLDWYDKKSLNYFQTIEEDKKNDYNTLQELNSIYKIYEYLLNNYEDIGNDIYYDETKKDEIINLLNDIIKETSTIINKYNNIGIFNYSERSMLYYQKNIFMKILEKGKKIKSQIEKNIYKIEKIENKVEEDFNKITITPIKEKDIIPFK